MQPANQRIQTQQRDIRVSVRNRRPVVVVGSISKISAFAQRIFDRYTLQSGSWQRLYAVLMRPWIDWLPQVAQSLRMVLAPHIHLMMTGSAADSQRQLKSSPRKSLWDRLKKTRRRQSRLDPGTSLPSGSIQSTGGAVSRLGAAQWRAETDLVTATRVLSPVMEVVQRLTKRGQRIEGWLYNDPRATRHPMRAGDFLGMNPVAKPVPRVVHHPGGHSEHAESQAPTAKPNTAKALLPATSTSPSATDIERLTSDVVRAIDRRIIAQRERLGRI